MTTTTRKRAQQPSSCPDDYEPAGYVVPLRLTVRQQIYCRRAVGISRFVYNLCAATHAFCRVNRLPWPSWQDLSKEINAAKKQHTHLISKLSNTPEPQLTTDQQLALARVKREGFAFLTEVSYRVTEGAIRDFGTAVANWRNPNTKGRRPTFKKRRLTGTGSFQAAAGVRDIKYNGKRRIKLPCLGSVKLDHTLPQGIIHQAHISFRNGQWLLSINYWQPPVEQPKPDTRIVAGAADTGINPSAIDSELQALENPKAYYQAEKRLARWQRAQARRTRGKTGWWEAQRKTDRLHRRIVNLRKNAQHQMTSQLVHKFQHLVIEDLNVAGMMRGSTPKAQADAAMGEIKRQIIYKGQWHHCQVTLAPRFYPSSKTCSNCGYVNAKLKRQRYWQCPSCTQIHERNENAATNLRNLLVLPALSGTTLCNGSALAVGDPNGETNPNDQRTAPLSQRAPPIVIR